MGYTYNYSITGNAGKRNPSYKRGMETMQGCRGYTVGHITSPHPGLIECELTGGPRPDEGQGYWLVFVSSERGGQALLRTAPLPKTGLHPPAEVMALRKYIGGGRITGCCNTRREALLSLAGKSEGEAVCRFGRQGLVSLRLADGRLVLGREDGSFAGENNPAQWEEGNEPVLDDGVLLLLFEKEKARCLRKLDAEIKKQRRLINNLDCDLEKFAEHEAVQRQGELLKSQLYKLRRGMDSVELEDWFSPGADGRFRTIRVALDPVKDPGANLTAFFARAARYRRGLSSVSRRLAEVKLLLARLESERARYAEVGFPNFTALPQQGATLGRGAKTLARPTSKTGQKRALPWRTFVKENVIILAGKNAAANAHLSLKLASGNDLWLHAKNWPGSHVLLRRKNKKHVFSEEEIQLAAVIALYYSEAKKFGREEVMLTEAKYVRRVPGAATGTVSAAASRSLLVTLDEEKVRAALASQE